MVTLFCVCLALASDDIKNFECADKATCDKDCEKWVKTFEEEYSHGWAVRHPSLAHHYRSVECKVCVEVGVARGELARYLIKSVPSIPAEYHDGGDPLCWRV